ncbi:hypothetical protein [Flagellimonas sp.]|uniref:hypothetical protein n=1 Tax=Flagellimonas sp. TaxID=2058762 RepID=UPI003BAFE0BB
MNSGQINILEFPSNLGLKKTELVDEPGVGKLPEWLMKHGFHKKIRPKRVFKLDAPAYSMELDEISKVRNVGNIVDYSIEQSRLLSSFLDEDTFQLILGVTAAY